MPSNDHDISRCEQKVDAVQNICCFPIPVVIDISNAEGPSRGSDNNETLSVEKMRAKHVFITMTGTLFFISSLCGGEAVGV